MTKARKPSSTPDRAPVVADAGTIRQALTDLGIDRPYYACRVAGSCLEFTLYGGDVVTWRPKPASKPKQARSRRKS